jgi:hypothetical protein
LAVAGKLKGVFSEGSSQGLRSPSKDLQATAALGGRLPTRQCIVDYPPGGGRRVRPRLRGDTYERLDTPLVKFPQSMDGRDGFSIGARERSSRELAG